MVCGSAGARRPRRRGQKRGPSWKPLIFEMNKARGEARSKHSQQSRWFVILGTGDKELSSPFYIRIVRFSSPTKPKQANKKARMPSNIRMPENVNIGIFKCVPSNIWDILMVKEIIVCLKFKFNRMPRIFVSTFMILSLSLVVLFLLLLLLLDTTFSLCFTAF